MVLKQGGDCCVILISSGILATKLIFFFSWLQHTAKYICGVMIHEGSHEARKAAPHGVLQPTPSACSYGGPGCKKTELDDFLERVAFLHSYISYYDYDLSFT